MPEPRTKVTAYSYNYRRGKKIVGHALLFTNPNGRGVINHVDWKLPSGETFVGHVVAQTWQDARRLLHKQMPDAEPVDRPLTGNDVKVIVREAGIEERP